MSTSKPYDLLVIGEEPAGFAAAACAARTGARVAVLRAAQARPAVADIYAADIPNFVWRRLDLQNAGLSLKRASARVSIFDDGETAKTYRDPRRTSDALKAARLADADVWEDFVSGLRTDAARTQAVSMRLAAGPALNGEPFAPNLSDLKLMTNVSAGYLDDYFEDDKLKTHVASAALSLFGLGGDEPGSAGALAALFEENAWPVRAAKGTPAVAAALERACADAHVEFLKGEIKRIESDDPKYRSVDLGPGGTVRTRFIFCASSRAGRALGVRTLQPLAPMDRRGSVEAYVHLKLSRPAEAPGGDKNAVFYVAGSMRDLTAARAEALEGRIPAAPPLVFELTTDGDIFVRAPYCPERLVEEGEAREWSEQDRQSLSIRIIKRLAPYIEGLESNIKKVETRVFSPPGRDEAPAMNPLDTRIVAPPPSGNPIGAAVRLADGLLNRD